VSKWCLDRVNNFLRPVSLLLRPRVRYGYNSHLVQLETRGRVLRCVGVLLNVLLNIDSNTGPLSCNTVGETVSCVVAIDAARVRLPYGVFPFFPCSLFFLLRTSCTVFRGFGRATMREARVGGNASRRWEGSAHRQIVHDRWKHSEVQRGCH
jgi:hypothetical protein